MQGTTPVLLLNTAKFVHFREKVAAITTVSSTAEANPARLGSPGPPPALAPADSPP